MVMALPIKFQMVSPWVAMSAVSVVCDARKRKPKQTTCKNSMPNFAVSPESPMAPTIQWDEGKTSSVMENPKRMLPRMTMVIVVRAWLFALAPINCDAILAPACENA